MRLRHHTESLAIAKSLFPDRQHENEFFVTSPRKIFAHLLKYRPSPQDLCDWIARPDQEIDRRVAGTPLEAIIAKNAPQQRSGVLGVLERVTAPSSCCLPGRNGAGQPQAGRSTGGLDLHHQHPGNPRCPATAGKSLARLAAATADGADGTGQWPVWVILDELASLQTLPNLPFALSESRKSNTRMVLGLQGRSQIEARYGREAEAMLSQPRTKIFLRTERTHGAEWVSKSIGEVEIEHLREGRNVGDRGFRRSQNATVDRRIEAAVLASEISNLRRSRGLSSDTRLHAQADFPYLAPKRSLLCFALKFLRHWH